MNARYVSIYNRLKQAGIPCETCAKAAADLFLIGLSPRFDALQMTDAFITTYRANAATALDALEELMERVEAMS